MISCHTQGGRVGSMISLIVLSFLGIGISVGVASGKTVDDLSAEMKTLQEGQANIQRQLEEIQKLLKASGKRPKESSVRDLNNVEVSITGDPVKGNGDAKLVMMEFSDYQCPYCVRHSVQVLPRLDTVYIQTGKMKYVMRDFPLEQIHPQAFQSAIAANCAGEQGQYWAMHDRLFAHRKNLGTMNGHAEALKLDMVAFHHCMESDQQVAEVRADMKEARRLGVRSTPSFVLGVVDPESGKISGVRFIKGALSFDRMSKEIDQVLLSMKAKLEVQAEK